MRVRFDRKGKPRQSPRANNALAATTLGLAWLVRGLKMKSGCQYLLTDPYSPLFRAPGQFSGLALRWRMFNHHYMALISCPECSKQVSTAAPQCPQCGYPLSNSVGKPAANLPNPVRASTPAATSNSPVPIPHQATHIVIHQPAKNHKGLARAAWILIFLVCGVALLPFLGFASWLVAGPVFFVTFILSIMVIARGGTLTGILLLFTSIIGGPVFVTFAPFVSSFLGLGVAAKASIQNSERSATPQGNNYVNPTPTPPVVTPEEAARQRLLAAKRQVEEDLAGARFPDVDVGELWVAMMNSRAAVAITLNEYDVNYYLRRILKQKEGAFVTFASGAVTITTQGEAKGQQLLNSVTFRARFVNGVFSPEIIELFYDNLPVHPTLGVSGSSTLAGLAKAFEKQIQQFDRFADVHIAHGRVTLVTKPAK